jgi:hypothetical protein
VNAIVYAIPVFLALMAAEYGIGLALRVGIYVVVYDHFASCLCRRMTGRSGCPRFSPITPSIIGTSGSARQTRTRHREAYD